MTDTTAPYDVLIVGTGVAGLTLALRLPAALRIAMIAKGPLTEGSSLYAQGGISAVLDAADSVDDHVRDTLTAGAGLTEEATARFVAEHAPAAIRWLVDAEVPFSRAEGEAADLHLHREGGHSHRRIVHAADATGRAVETTLEGAVRARENVTVLEHTMAVELITERHTGGEPRCHGAYVLDRRSGRVRTLPAHTVVLATGGASKVYLYTSNPDGATGDGIAMAWRAGCRVANMEFNQFHPTCLYHPRAKSFLISEAVRGEGAVLRLPDGERFMPHFDERAELAPRDVVARAIDHEMKRLGVDCVYLDISHRDAAFIRGHFPTIHARCLEFGIDMTREPIPVVPAAHYTCGGVVVDRHGRTDLPGLHAIGECSYTGLHGANRLASNSLLECLVYGMSAAEVIPADCAARSGRAPAVPPWDESLVTDSDEQVVVSHNWDEIRRFMWDYVGIVRTDKRLERARHRVDLLAREIAEYYRNFRVTPDLIELRNLAVVAELIVRSATARRESRGLHFTRDHPEPSADPAPTVLTPGYR
ncbi:L-aspartate oxidase [wastewater metagenome]|uniref:L-aspartate oxidase n=2 Tax=unclassified sequences TaxID=12908 RepID=A0A5B8RCW2_9ZZZZ|nr:L-aspartate oxidase [Arhodomonas aquaeolei]QEA04605.1 L-aspartate oxidase [uncultured organism]